MIYVIKYNIFIVDSRQAGYVKDKMRIIDMENITVS